MYFTLEGENPRFQKNCAKDNTFINTFFYKGEVFRGMEYLVVPRGYLGQSLYHLTIGSPDLELDEGSYTLLVYNFAFQETHGATKKYSI